MHVAPLVALADALAVVHAGLVLTVGLWASRGCIDPRYHGSRGVGCG